MAIVKIQGEAGVLGKYYYEVDLANQPIGVGGMGQVFKGVRVSEDTGIRKDVAIKFLYEDLPSTAIERAQREASIRIQHENLVEMYEFVKIVEQTPHGKVERAHVVSELLDGVMLYDIIHNRIVKNSHNIVVPLAEKLLNLFDNDRVEFAIYVTKNLLSGVMALHDNHYIHRDLDPSNVMVTSDNKIKIIDFGIAKRQDVLSTADRPMTMPGQIVCKPAYAAPEQVLGDVKSQNKTTDLYAIGIMLYEFVTGHLPFDGSVSDVIKKQQFSKLPMKEVKNKYLKKIIEKATSKKSEERFQSAAEFRVALERIDTKKQTQTSATTGDADMKNVFIWGGVAIAGLAVGCILALLI